MRLKKVPAKAPSVPEVTPVTLTYNYGAFSLVQGGNSGNFKGTHLDWEIAGRYSMWGDTTPARKFRIDPAKLALLIQLHGEEVK